MKGKALLIMAVVLSLFLTACSGGPPTPTPSPNPIPGEGAGADNGGTQSHYYVVGSEKVRPQEWGSDHIFRLAEDDQSYRDLWAYFGFQNAAPTIQFEDWTVLFASTGESGSCPEVLKELTVNGSTVVVSLGFESDAPNGSVNGTPAKVCTSDFTPRTIAVGIKKNLLPTGPLQAEFENRWGSAPQTIRQ